MRNWFLILALLTFGCKSSKVVHYLNEDASFEKFNSYYLLNLKSKSRASEDNIIPRLEENIQQQMAERGYELSIEEPDLILRYELVASTETDVNMNRVPFGYFGTVSVRTFNSSILLLEMKSQKSNKLVWHASIDMQNHQDLRKRKDPLEAAVNRLFTTYPYRAGTSQMDKSLESDE